jgi:hypothetical protein
MNVGERKEVRAVLRDTEKYLGDARKHVASEEQCLAYLQAAILRAQFALEIILAGQRDQ